MKNDIIATKQIANEILEQKNQFKGYTLDQIRYQRAVVALQKEFTKEKVASDIHRIQKRGLFGAAPEKGPKWARIGNVVSKLAGGFNYLDYFLLGASVLGTGKKVCRIFKKR